jgi:sugar (pentulose or hexulose) kinase
MKFIGYDIGSSSIKASIIDDNGKVIAHAKYLMYDISKSTKVSFSFINRGFKSF